MNFKELKELKEQYNIKRKEWNVYFPESYYEPEEVEGYKINASAFQYYAPTDCYRELLVSYMPIIPLLKKQVRIEDADYLIFTHGYARCEDLTDAVCDELRFLASKRKEGAEIIVVGKSANAKEILKDEIENITFVGDHYAEYLGKRFGFPEVKEQYVVYDDYLDQLNVWPVDGCNNKCKFCRRSYMYIRFESQQLEFLKEQLDWYQSNEPKKMKHISLRAENLTEYGIDIYGKPMLHKVIELIDSYEAVKEITIDIGLCIGEITSEILDALCNTKKLTGLWLNLEAGSDRVLKLIGKKHTCKQAVEIYSALRDANPEIKINTTVMIGLPTETIYDMYSLAALIRKVWPHFVQINYYISSSRDGLSQYRQMSASLKEYHLKILIRQIRMESRKKYKYLELHPNIYIRYPFIWGKKLNSRKWIKHNMEREAFNKKYNKDFPQNMPFQYRKVVHHVLGYEQTRSY